MDTNDLFLTGKSPKRELQLQGPRPPPLSVRKDSHKIRKPPVAPANRLHHHHHQPPHALPREPVIIYAVSPKVIHTNPNEFMALVQRLTGSSAAPWVDQPDPFVSSVGAVSPAARYAIVEKANKSRVITSNTSYGVTDDVYQVGSQTGLMPPHENLVSLVHRFASSSTAPRIDQPDPFVSSVGAFSPAARYATMEKANKSRVIINTRYGVADDTYRVGSQTCSMLPNDFTALVQRFTGSYAAPWVHKPDPSFNSDGAVSPVARYATVEKAEKLEVANNIDDDVADEFRRVGSQMGLVSSGILLPGLVPSPNDFIALLQRFIGSPAAPWVNQPNRTVSRVTNNIGDDVADEFRRAGSITGSIHPGILSPGPASLRPVPAAFFSPPSNGNPLGFIHDLISPAGFYNTGLNYSELSSLLQSPTPFVSPRLISPLPSMDLFNHFFDL